MSAAGVRGDGELAPRRVFVSYAGPDKAWAEWVRYELKRAGFVVELDTAEWEPGDNFVTRMSEAIEKANIVLALFSSRYFDIGRFTSHEWTAVLAGTASGRGQQTRIIPCWVSDYNPDIVPAILRPLIHVSLWGLDEASARQLLLGTMAERPRRLLATAKFPGRKPGNLGMAPSRFPGSLPAVWNIPTRSAVFTGREELLARVHAALQSGAPVAVTALHGLGGVGKTLLAVEFAHRYCDDYVAAWWVDAEKAERVPEQLAGLASQLGLVPSISDTAYAANRAIRYLGGASRHLLVFDNAGDPASLLDFLPGGLVHVLVTSRNPTWQEIGHPVSVDVLQREEAITLLKRCVDGIGNEDADRVAARLGDLPLALAQASGVLSQGIHTSDYMLMLDAEAHNTLGGSGSLGHPTSMAQSVRVARDRLAVDHPAAGHLLDVCVWLAADPIPAGWFVAGNEALSKDDLAGAADPVGTVRSNRMIYVELDWIVRLGLARWNGQALIVHRVTAQIVRRLQESDELGALRVEALQRIAGRVLARATPDETDDARSWPTWNVILPHVGQLNLEGALEGELRELACRAARVLAVQGSYVAARDLSARLVGSWTESLGATHPDTLTAAHHLANALGWLGDYVAARDLDRETLAARRSILGWDHPDTLWVAHSLAIELAGLGDYVAARELDEDTLARSRARLGERHPDTLRSANSLANDLAALGEYESARDLHRETLHRRRATLGEDHPDTLWSAHSLANALNALGRHEEARELYQGALKRRRTVLGQNHPDTLWSAHSLANALNALGRHEEALELHEETLQRRADTLGDNHPDTLRSANSLARALDSAGLHAQARVLFEETLDKRRTHLGMDHPDTLRSANHLALVMRLEGDIDAARALDEDTLTRRRRILGEGHPDTRRSARNLAIDLRALGHPEDAGQLEAGGSP